jgi:hypothetical protein
VHNSNTYNIVIHMRHNYAGLVALKEGKVNEAKTALFKAGQISGSAPLNTFGPNLSLASELLKLGEIKDVLKFFHSCKEFWWFPFRLLQLSKWKRDIAKGLVPDFGANLNYYMESPERM